MMEGTYFFGEHLRWNLGWNNPNPAGAFIATLIPWMWGVARIVVAGRGKTAIFAFFVVSAELALWFLLCKTYSRGALMAAGGALCFWGFALLWARLFMGPSGVPMRGPSHNITDSVTSSDGRVNLVHVLTTVRLVGVSLLLLQTEFLQRIEPGYVADDASAGNRLILWKGGLQMIATSPWVGWGRGQSGDGFMHWFQPLDAVEAYAGMVNSYLHVGVEYGLPLLLGVLVVFFTLVILSLHGGGFQRSKRNAWNALDWLILAAGASLVAFLAANVFSTLWIFRNLWWVVVAAGMLIVLLGVASCRKAFLRRLLHAFGLAFLFCIFLGALLYSSGNLLSSEVGISMPDKHLVAVNHSTGSASTSILVIPDASVLGSHWGKEIRRMAADPEFRDAEIFVSRGMPPASLSPPEIIIACGNNADVGIAASERFPDAKLILVHPVGRPVIEMEAMGDITVLLPGLDTTGSGRVWRKACRDQGWECRINAGVGQDVRLLWPDVLLK